VVFGIRSHLTPRSSFLNGLSALFTNVLPAPLCPPAHRLIGHTGRVGSLALCPDGRCIASGGRDGTVWQCQLELAPV
jgi:WD40 repeat protein